MSYGSPLNLALYYRLPVSCQNLVCTVYGYRHKRLYKGNHFWRYFHALQQNQWKSTDAVLDLQWRRLAELLRHAYEFVPFYRQQWKQLGVTPGDIASIDDFRRLPLLGKEQVKTSAELIQSRALPRGDLHTVHTSGTSGKQLTLWVSQEAYEREYSFRWHHYSWSGTKLGSRVAYLSGHPVVPAFLNEPPFSRRNYADNSLLLSSQHLSEPNLAHYARDLKAFQPEMIEGYPSSLYLLAAYLNANNIRDVRPHGVYCISETLFEFQRKEIEQAFGCQTFNWYGNTERAGNITQCDRGSLHVQLEHAVTEFLDDDDHAVAPGQVGSLVVTGLGNFAFPLIRYRVGDTVIPRGGGCGCGRSGNLVQRIVGRVEDYVISPDGRCFGRLDHIFKDAARVREAQIVQDRIDHVLIRVVPRPNYGPADTAQILWEANVRMGTSLKMDVALVDRIERTANGKFRFIVSQLAPEEKRRFSLSAACLDTASPAELVGN